MKPNFGLEQLDSGGAIFCGEKSIGGADWETLW